MSIYVKKSSETVIIADDSRFISQADIKTDNCSAGISVKRPVEDEAPQTYCSLLLDNNITVNVSKNIYAFDLKDSYQGIACAGDSLSLLARNYSKKLNVSVKFTDNTIETLSVSGIECFNLSILGSSFLHSINVSASNKKNSLAAGIFTSNVLLVESELSKPIKVSAASADYGASANSYGVFAGSDIYILSSISGSITASANSQKGIANSCGIYTNRFLNITAPITGKITVSASGNQNVADVYTLATGICANHADADETSGAYSNINGIKGAVSVTSKNAGNAISLGFSAGGTLLLNDQNKGALTVKATSSQSEADAIGMTAKDLIIFQWDGKTAVTAQGSSASAVFIQTDNACTISEISSNISVTASASNDNAMAIGFNSPQGITFGDIAGMKLNVKATSKKGDATAIGLSSSTGGILLQSTILDLGKITVSAIGKKSGTSLAAGLSLTGSVSTSNTLNQTLIGKIKSTTSTGIAYGVIAKSIDAVSALDIEVKGHQASCAYQLDGQTESNLVLNSGTVKATVYDKNFRDSAWAVFCSDGDAANTVLIESGSNITGHINLAGGTDKVLIGQEGYFNGALTGVENISILASTGNRKKAAWNVQQSDLAETTRLNIVFDYGLTGKFVICSKKSDMAWSDVLENNIDLTVSTNTIENAFNLNAGGSFEDEFFKMELEFKGNNMLLNVTEKLI